MSRLVVASALSLALIASALASTAAAYDFGCQYVWSGPSTDNDVMDCAKEFPKEKPGLIIPMAIPIFFFLVLLIAFPIIFLGRCCGACGSNTQRPGADCCCDGSEWDAVDDKDEIAAVYHSKPRAITCVKCTAFLLLIASIASVVLLPLGASQAITGWEDALDRVDTDIINWVVGKKDELMTSLRDPSDGSLPSPLTNDSFQMFDDAVSDVKSIRDDLNDGTDQAVTGFSYATYALAAVPTVCMILVGILAFCNCQKCCPACFQCIFYPLGLIYALLSALFLTAGMLCLLTHGEGDLQEKALPGIFGWYLVPYCESEIKFESIKETVNDAIVQASVEGCQQILQFCDNEQVLTDPTSQYQFYCPLIADQDLQVVCRTPTALSNVVNNTYAKQNAVICGVGVNCSVSECPSECAVQDARDKAQEAIDGIAVGIRVSKALAKAFLFADCDVLLAQFVKPLSELQGTGYGFVMGGIGFAVGMMCFILSILVLCKGQKLFVAKPTWMGSNNGKPY